MKSQRLDAIRSIVRGHTVQNQDELQKLLVLQGINVTQATLSRDLRELGIVKVQVAGRGYCYALPNQGTPAPVSPQARRFTVETIKSVEFSGNQGVIKTYPGFAGAVASVIDDNVHSGIMGTIAGDDAILVILRENAEVPKLVSEISLYIQGFESKLINNS